MVLRLDRADADFEARFAAFLATKREVSADVDAAVRDIVMDVRRRGDAALADYSLRFDRLDFAATPLRVSTDEIAAATQGADPRIVAALKLAYQRILSHHSRQKPAGCMFTAGPRPIRARC